MNLILTVYHMLTSTGVLFKIVRKGGQLLLGRPVSAGYVGGDLSAGAFRIYESYEQFSSGADVHLNREEMIQDGDFIVVQRVGRDNQNDPSTYERILQLNAEIQAFDEDYMDHGIIVKNIPDTLVELKAALERYFEEQGTTNAEVSMGLLDSHIAECRNCPLTFGQTAEEDITYKITTILQAKYYANEAVRIALGSYVPKTVLTQKMVPMTKRYPPKQIGPIILDEICSMAKLEPFRATLEAILLRIHAQGCIVWTRTDITASSFLAEPEPVIRVSLLNVEEPLNVIWRLLHEFGHFLSPVAKQEDDKMEREELAWRKADELVKEYPTLVVHMDKYEQCKEQDLDTYRRFLDKKGQV
jgi:hypothetical protein